MNWNFSALVEELDLDVYDDVSYVPNTTGVYMLFAENGDFIYVGKASDLRQRLTDHFGPNEENKKINGRVEHAIWLPTRTIDEAEEAEGNLYDTWFRHTGQPPYANEIQPPKSKSSDIEIRVAKLLNSSPDKTRQAILAYSRTNNSIRPRHHQLVRGRH